MDEISVLIGGQAGDGINQAGLLIARLLAQLGYRIYVNYDYPSLIRGGHNFSLIRAAANKIGVCHDRADYLLALNQETVDRHAARLTDPSRLIYDSDSAKTGGLGIPLKTILKEVAAPELTRNSCLIGAFARCAGVEWSVLEKVFKKDIPRELEVNLKLARRGFESAEAGERLEPLGQEVLPLVSGNEACALGFIAAGLDAYIAYPMTPSSSLLHFLAQKADGFKITVIHPESEIAVMLMALGFAYAGKKAAVGTSGGGFCLMTEGFSLSGMAEIPVAVVVGQRPGPSTGLPTYTSQTELHFVMNAGQGEFPRFVVAPGDAEESYYWSAVALNLAWKYQIPSIILMDKTVCEGTYSFDIASAGEVTEGGPALWNGEGQYRRYLNTETGVSPLAFPPDKRAVVKVNSYEHDENGITTEDPRLTTMMQEKRMHKGRYLAEEISRYGAVGVHGDRGASTALICWGSNKGVCVEAGERLGMRVVHAPVLAPFPISRLREALGGVTRIISVENNATGQFTRLLNTHGVSIGGKVLKYDGRQFSLEELERELAKVT
jgi:2-oxoglutarate/2-oxoacid ferredoxin oxidoreductase subunit alpha